MAQAGLLIGFGQPARAREAQAVELLRRLLDSCREREQAGELTSVEPVLLAPHGGDLNGFVLLRADEQHIDRLRRSDGFLRLVARAGLVADNVGVADARVGEGFEAAIARYEQQLREQLAS